MNAQSCSAYKAKLIGFVMTYAMLHENRLLHMQRN